MPTPGPGEVLVKIAATGVCHTDLHAADGDWPVRPSPPFVPGHEGTGIVAALGAGVRGLKEGDAVGVAWHARRLRRLRILHDRLGNPVREPAQQRLQRERHVRRVRDRRRALRRAAARRRDFAELAPILCAGVTTYKGIRETEARPGEWIAISGIGGLGHLAVQYAKAMGLHVAALDIGEEKLALARRLGADLAVDARAPDAVARVLAATGGGAHGVLVTAVSPPAFRQAIDLTRRRGTVSLVGLPPGDFATPIFDVVLKRISAARLDRRHAPRSRRGAAVRRRGQGARAPAQGAPVRHQRRVRRAARRPRRRAHRDRSLSLPSNGARRGGTAAPRAGRASAHDQHRQARTRDRARGDRAEQQVAQRAVPARAHHDEIACLGLRHARDDARRIADCGDLAERDARLLQDRRDRLQRGRAGLGVIARGPLRRRPPASAYVRAGGRRSARSRPACGRACCATARGTSPPCGCIRCHRQPAGSSWIYLLRRGCWKGEMRAGAFRSSRSIAARGDSPLTKIKRAPSSACGTLDPDQAAARTRR